MMQLENIRWTVEDGVGLATIDRPKALNALDSRTIKELAEIISTVAADTSIRVLVLTGGGDRAFVAGADVSEMVGLQPIEARCFAEVGQRTIGKLERLCVPTLAAVNGFALGGGCELAMACDLVYASDKAKFGQPEVNLGIIPGFGGTQRLARRVGITRAKELIFSGEAIDAARAKELGLVLDVVSPERLLPFVLERARKIASRPRIALEHAKRVIEAGATLDLSAGCAMELDAFALLFATEDAHEGMRAFLEKRPAKFKNG